MDFKDVFSFLKQLSKNNNRDWFQKNKERYVEMKEFFEDFVSQALDKMILNDPSLRGLDPKKLVFRIYRDVRFSKDKKPYKTNFAAGFSSSGKGLGKPGYYLHIEPGNKSMVAGGLYMPEAGLLAKVRQEIDYNGDTLKKIFSNPAFKRHFGDFWDGDKLKTVPKGYQKEHPYIEWLRLKSFIVEHSFKDSEVTDKSFLKAVVDAHKKLQPLNAFLTEATA